MNANRVTSARGIRMLHVEEGTVLHVYRDAAGVDTVCTGHMIRPADRAIVEDGVTPEECDAFLRGDLKSAEAVVNSVVTAVISQNMFDALVSFQFNTGALPKSSVLRYTNANAYQLAAAAFTLWVKRRDPKTGQLVVDPVLVRRRQQEAALFLTPDSTSDKELDQLLAAMEASQFDLADLIDWRTGACRETSDEASSEG